MSKLEHWMDDYAVVGLIAFVLLLAIASIQVGR